MKLIYSIAILSTSRHATAFSNTVPRSRTITKSYLSSNLNALPTVDDVSTDDFMKQLGHASQIIPLIHPQDDDEQIMSNDDLLQLLSLQLNHSDGIRGFFATYLTSPESLTTEEVPQVLADAVKSSDMEVMIPLACMNVIMPMAMTSIHQDDELKECAKTTAKNGIKILKLLKEEDLVVKNCNAILKVCNGEEEEGDDMIKYWAKFFKNYKYEGQQKKDIAQAITEFV